MPFTLSHPAAVLPLIEPLGRRIRPLGLVLGSMAPDFQYMLFGRVHGGFSHSLPGLVLFCVPAGILACLVTLYLLRPAALLLAPSGLRARLAAVRFRGMPRSLRGWLALAAGIVIGAATHLLWDSCTHRFGWLVERAGLRREVPIGVGHHLPIYELLQHASTLLGLALVVIAVVRWYRSAPALPVARRISERTRRLLVAAIVLCTAAGSLLSAIFVARRHGPGRPDVFVVQLALAAMDLGVILPALVTLAAWLAGHFDREVPGGNDA